MVHKNTGNAHARKDPSERADSHLHLRVRESEKRHWAACAASEGISLAQWVIGCLNAAVDLTDKR